ncbi:glycosyltransferase family 2 protein [Paenibacillus radicis (ex Xue et al. 2023)]|uniref:Glycosyltransferase family 2 protein n=1 Tax=Paenibacillus radicis (ex Xue et al. 2023) TaxID=2972489 RepID=A0ABT1YS31_9BACL|nr:glycosyltransferase family 2 protein [Paenibacillus radicis (ex Xue et al. 2023)]MCR8635987.1 glycosyltransferase family 2 protein [Paenibacillus radicis (ex Xue et al. 2023)]
MKLSIVTTLYRSSPYINEFYERISAVVKKLTEEYEIIFVNDGSPDNSLELSIELHKKDNKVKVINLSKNFGHHKAIMTGLKYSKGDLVFLIDSDLEEDPELLEKFWVEMTNNSSADVIYGVQESRRGDFVEKITGNLFYKIYNLLSSEKVVENSAMSRLMRKSYVKALVSHQEREIFLMGLWSISGFNQSPMTIKKYSTSPSTYTLNKKINLMVNALTSFSNKPLEFIFHFGVMISIASLIFILYLLTRQLFFGVSMQGWTSVIVSIWLVGGIVIFSIGLVGIYISKIFTEVKQRPYTIVKDFFDKENTLEGESND